MNLPPANTPFVHIRRLASTVHALRPNGTVHPDTPQRDRFGLIVPGDIAVETMRGLSVATHTSRSHAPRLVPQWCPDALVLDDYRGDPAFFFFGFTYPRYVRNGVERQDLDAELIIHNYEGRNDGCPCAPQPWINASAAYLDELARSGAWEPRRRSDGRWTVGVLVDECAA